MRRSCRRHSSLAHGSIFSGVGASPIPGAVQFIPTHVGNTTSRRAAWPSGTVHPHARGEHMSEAVAAPALGGSSPRTWGTPACHRKSPSCHRFIPTHVGNTIAQRGAAMAKTVHPHARGEHWFEIVSHHAPDGSSPRTWGTLVEIGVVLPGRRFIPTHVGNTRTVARESSFSSVHPHARGEHATIRRLKPPADGSSPRTWGTHRP